MNLKIIFVVQCILAWIVVYLPDFLVDTFILKEDFQLIYIPTKLIIFIVVGLIVSIFSPFISKDRPGKPLNRKRDSMIWTGILGIIYFCYTYFTIEPQTAVGSCNYLSVTIIKTAIFVLGIAILFWMNAVVEDQLNQGE